LSQWQGEIIKILPLPMDEKKKKKHFEGWISGNHP
jgi:hypothetical protein